MTMAFGGELVLDAKVPAHLVLDGEVVAELYQPALLHLPLDAGSHRLVLTTEGQPEPFEFVSAADSTHVLLAGRTGNTLSSALDRTQDDPPDADVGPVSVRFRTAGNQPLMVQIARQRVVVSPGEGVDVSLPVGTHAMSLRSSDGTSVYARGMLKVGPTEDAVVQIGEGAMPETSGPGVAFHPDPT